MIQIMDMCKAIENVYPIKMNFINDTVTYSLT